MLFWPASISTNCSDLLAIQKTRMDDLSSGQSCQDIAQNSVTDLNPTQEKQLTEETNAFEITGGDFSGAHVGPQTYNLTRQGIVGGNFEGANFGAQNIQQIFNNTYVTQAATESERTETWQAIKKEGNTDFIDLSDSIRICKTKPLCKHGNVFHGEQTSDICDARAIAVKLIPYNEENVKEAKTLLKLSSHPNVVRIIHSATYHHSLYMYIAMELCQTLNLHDHIISNKHAAFDAEKSLSWARQVTEAIDHIHKNRILHRDLKPHNILISVGHNMLKISDFGLSKELRSGRSVTAQSSRRVGTDGYRAPETYNSDLISQQADIFSLGLVVFFIWSNGSHPYGDDPDDWNSNIKRDRNRNLDNLLIPNAVTARILLSCMLQFDPRMRPTAEKVLKHKAFTAKEDEYGEFIPPITLQRQSERLPGNSFRDNAQSRPLPPVLRTTSWDTSSWNRPMRGSDADDLYVALFAYRGVKIEDLDFDEGDKLRVVEKSGGWWYATSLSSNETGYIPSNYVVRVNNHDSYPWYFGKISRKIATALLELPGTQSGTFLVRESESGSETLSLSVWCGSVVHYRIMKPKQGKGYYLPAGTKSEGHPLHGEYFERLPDLIEYYSKNHAGLCCRLTRPCAKSQDPNVMQIDLRQWEIARSSLLIQEVIATGATGQHWKGIWKGTTDVTIKIPAAGQGDLLRCLQEVNILSKLQHENIVKFIGVVTCDPINIVTEFTHRGKLSVYLCAALCADNDDHTKVITPTEIEIALQIASAMAYLTQMRCVHRNLQAESVLIGDDSCKLGDFSLARLLPDGADRVSCSSEVLPVKWSAPEIFRDAEFLTKSDVWSFGIFLFEINSKGEVPYKDATDVSVRRNIVEGYRLPRPPSCPEKIYEIMMQCWEQEPAERPGFEELQGLLTNFMSTLPEEENDSDETSADGNEVTINQTEDASGNETVIVEGCGGRNSEAEHVKRKQLTHIMDKKENESELEKGGNDSALDVAEANRGDWEISRPSLFIQEMITGVDACEYWKGIWKDTEKVTVKIPKAGFDDRTKCLLEVNLLKKLRHENIVKFLGVVQSDPVKIVLEFIPGGNLLKRLRALKGFDDITTREQIDAATQISSAMLYLARRRCLYRDLRAENIQVDGTSFKLCEFYFATELPEGSEYVSSERKIPVRWTAPEVHRDTKFYAKSDVWSFGILLFEINTLGKLPYKGWTNDMVSRNIIEGYRLPRPPNCPEMLYDIMLQCWKEEKERPNFKELQDLLETFISTLPEEEGETSESGNESETQNEDTNQTAEEDGKGENANENSEKNKQSSSTETNVGKADLKVEKHVGQDDVADEDGQDEQEYRSGNQRELDENKDEPPREDGTDTLENASPGHGKVVEMVESEKHGDEKDGVEFCEEVGQKSERDACDGGNPSHVITPDQSKGKERKCEKYDEKSDAYAIVNEDSEADQSRPIETEHSENTAGTGERENPPDHDNESDLKGTPGEDTTADGCDKAKEYHEIVNELIFMQEDADPGGLESSGQDEDAKAEEPKQGNLKL